jgi:signal transduction histidine kinase
MEQNIWDKEFSLDEIKVKQILRNLLLNALKYKNTFIALEVAEKEGGLFFSVMDDGKGIPPEYHKNIFKKYFQLDDAEKMEVRGHGLGLAGVQILVEDMGGKLSLESDVEKGAKFMVHIPIARRPTGY